MTETDEPFRRYCQEHGLCNRVVFDTVWRMATAEARMDVANDKPSARAHAVVSTPPPTPEKLIATWECVVTKTDGDLVYCVAYPLDETKTGDREFWEVEVPGNKWTDGDVFYVLRSR